MDHRFESYCVGVVDGDTLDLVAVDETELDFIEDINLYLEHELRVRLDGVDTAEIHNVDHDSDEYKTGLEHKAFVRNWLYEADVDYIGKHPIIVETEKRGKFNRHIATVERKSDGSILNEDLLDEFDVAY